MWAYCLFCPNLFDSAVLCDECVESLCTLCLCHFVRHLMFKGKYFHFHPVLFGHIYQLKVLKEMKIIWNWGSLQYVFPPVFWGLISGFSDFKMIDTKICWLSLHLCCLFVKRNWENWWHFGLLFGLCGWETYLYSRVAANNVTTAKNVIIFLFLM